MRQYCRDSDGDYSPPPRTWSFPPLGRARRSDFHGASEAQMLPPDHNDRHDAPIEMIETWRI